MHKLLYCKIEIMNVILIFYKLYLLFGQIWIHNYFKNKIFRYIGHYQIIFVCPISTNIANYFPIPRLFSHLVITSLAYQSRKGMWHNVNFELIEIESVTKKQNTLVNRKQQTNCDTCVHPLAYGGFLK